MSSALIKAISSHTDKEIKGFFEDYRWLSNFEVCDVVYHGLRYHSTEAAYQSFKTIKEELRYQFTQLSPYDAKKRGDELELRDDWDEIKSQIMYEVCFIKFSENKNLKDKLIATGDKYLEETNWWNDTYWGVCRGKGENNLGKILMRIRTKIS